MFLSQGNQGPAHIFVLSVGCPDSVAAGVPLCHASLRQVVQNIAAEYLTHQTVILEGGKNAVVIDHNATDILSRCWRA